MAAQRRSRSPPRTSQVPAHCATYADNTWNVDTLFLLTSGRNDLELVRLAYEEWAADTVEALPRPDLGQQPSPGLVLRIWWD